ncbi:M48 family metallopeptidase [Jatrophihabitans cynanchi]|uniref:M48 family metallopeptidase n=1 Tax=Jatrophihabitans cynanchi TaxID=2944128 RepID=A0ABY7JV44_9ACTN|nr:M48 family metallopeptidase [Jatrophihabitans sp. SB3-54]WAX56193.1 M48 family metallopeptidase [Jatrophihabitans sp. SB3-54]
MPAANPAKTATTAVTTAATTAARTAAAGGEPVEVRRSAKRRRTVSAYRDGGRIVVLIPARFTRAEEAEWVATMVARLQRGGGARRSGDAALARRAAELSRDYLDGRARPAGVRWVGVMRTQWASCTPSTGTIRLSAALRELPGWVQDYVLLHELAHLIVPGHGPRFWALLQAYPRTERARGYLDGVSASAGLSFSDDLQDDLQDDVHGDPHEDRAELTPTSG